MYSQGSSLFPPECIMKKLLPVLILSAFGLGSIGAFAADTPNTGVQTKTEVKADAKANETAVKADQKAMKKKASAEAKSEKAQAKAHAKMAKADAKATEKKAKANADAKETKAKDQADSMSKATPATTTR